MHSYMHRYDTHVNILSLYKSCIKIFKVILIYIFLKIVFINVWSSTFVRLNK